MLHIRCGDDILGRLEAAGVPGVRIRWADALCQGPTPSGLGPEEWRETRARHAEQFYGMPFQRALEFLRGQDGCLERYRDHDEIVLWFEHDLFDQIVLIYLLDWFGHQALGRRVLWLICPNHHIGNLGSADLLALFPTKTRVSPGQVAAASRAWAAFCDPDPSAIETLRSDSPAELPHLGPAFVRHLEEFPAVEHGLGRTEAAALRIIADGTEDPLEVFRAVQRQEERFWLGDTMFWPYLDRLASTSRPLLRIEGSGPWPGGSAAPPGRRLRLTATGEAVLAGAEDHVRLNGIDRWFGGVHLQGHDIRWRWDRRGQRLLLTQ